MPDFGFAINAVILLCFFALAFILGTKLIAPAWRGHRERAITSKVSSSEGNSAAKSPEPQVNELRSEVGSMISTLGEKAQEEEKTRSQEVIAAAWSEEAQGDFKDRMRLRVTRLQRAYAAILNNSPQEKERITRTFYLYDDLLSEEKREQIRAERQMVEPLNKVVFTLNSSMGWIQYPLEEKFTAFLDDLDALLEAFPAKVKDPIEIVGRDNPTAMALGRTLDNLGEVTLEENNCYGDAVFTAWLSKLGELTQVQDDLMRENREICLALDVHRSRAISSLSLSSVSRDLGSEAVLHSASVSPELEQAVGELSERLDTLPLIEVARAKRILANIVEAQALGDEVASLIYSEKQEEGGDSAPRELTGAADAESLSGDADGVALTIGGKSPREVVDSIISGNLEELREKVLVSSQQGGVDSALHRLEVLSIYTDEVRGR